MTKGGELLRSTLPIWLVLLISAAAVVVSLPVLSQSDAVFLFNDGAIETRLAEGNHPPDTLLRHWNRQFFFGLGMRTATPNTVQLLEWLLGAHQYRRWGVIFAIVFAGWAAFAGCRLSGRSRAASFVAGTVAGLCGWTVTYPMAGLPSRTWLLGWMFLSVGLVEHGRRTGRWLPTLLAGGVLGLAISDSPDVGVLASLCCAVYFILRHVPSKAGFEKKEALRSLWRFAAYVAVCALLAGQAVVNMYILHVKPPADASTETARSGDDRSYEWATQWSLPFNETWSLIACDFHGASTRSRTDPYWGRMGRTAGFEKDGRGYRNFKLTGYALGTVPFVLIIFGWIFIGSGSPDQRRLFVILNGTALLCLMLSWGKYHLAYRLFYELPMMSSIRNPEKWLCGFIVFVILAAALAFDLAARNVGSSRHGRPAETGLVWGAASVLPALLLVKLLSVSAESSFLADLRAGGFVTIAEIAYPHALHAVIMALICAAVSGAAIAAAVTGNWKRAIPVVAAVLVATSVVELVPAAAPYVMPHRYQHVLEPNPLISLLEENAPDNRIKVLPPDDDHLAYLRLGWLYARGFPLFDPISVRSMPPDYAAVIERLGDNPLVLWRLGAVRYVICTAKIAPQILSGAQGRFAVAAMFTLTPAPNGGLRPVIVSKQPDGRPVFFVLGYRDALRYVRISEAVRFVKTRNEALEELAAAELGGRWFDVVEAPKPIRVPGKNNARDSVEILSASTAELRVRTESAAGGMLIVAEAYDPHWTANVGGEETPIHRADGILQAVPIPSGRHEVTLSYRPPRAPLFVSIAGRLALILLLAASTLASLKVRRSHGEDGEPADHVGSAG